MPLVETVLVAGALGAFGALFWARAAMAVKSRNPIAKAAILFIQTFSFPEIWIWFGITCRTGYLWHG
jgi:hypothetical protein